eukprot:6183866-Pleurochrysis_carterae.AAC.1
MSEPSVKIRTVQSEARWSKLLRMRPVRPSLKRLGRLAKGKICNMQRPDSYVTKADAWDSIRPAMSDVYAL